MHAQPEPDRLPKKAKVLSSPHLSQFEFLMKALTEETISHNGTRESLLRVRSVAWHWERCAFHEQTQCRFMKEKFELEEDERKCAEAKLQSLQADFDQMAMTLAAQRLDSVVSCPNRLFGSERLILLEHSSWESRIIGIHVTWLQSLSYHASVTEHRLRIEKKGNFPGRRAGLEEDVDKSYFSEGYGHIQVSLRWKRSKISFG
jgi:hypothetical protein